MNSMKKQKGMTLRDGLLRSVGAQYATRHEWRTSSRKNEEAEPKRKQLCLDVFVITVITVCYGCDW